VPQKEIFEEKLPFAAQQWATAFVARYLAICSLRSRFDSDHPIERIALRTRESSKTAGILALRHVRPPKALMNEGYAYFGILAILLGTIFAKLNWKGYICYVVGRREFLLG